MKERILWLDIVKGIGIICVVIGHSTPAFLHPLYLFVYAFHMPLFFVISGLCFNKDKYVSSPIHDFIGSRTRQLLVPLLASCVLFWLISLIPGIDYYTTDDILNFSFPRAMWFVFSLFLVEILYFFLARSVKNEKMLNISIMVLSFVVAVLLSRKNIVLPFALSSLPLGLLYYTIGVMFRKRIFAINKYLMENTFVAYSVGCLSLLIVLIYVFAVKDSIDLSLGRIPQNEIITLFVSLCGIIMVTVIGMQISKINANVIAKLLNYIGNNTLTILMFHLFFIEMSTKFLRPLLGGIGTEPLTVWLWLFLIIPLVNKWAPWLVGKRISK